MPGRKKVEFIESYIKIGNGDYKWSDNHGELVRCKDCKWRGHEYDSTKWIPCLEIRTGADWFCANGERRDPDA